MFFSRDGQRRVGCGIFDDKAMGLFVAENESLKPGISIEISKGGTPVILIKNKEGELLWRSPIEKKE